jgi:hypothetical protein
MLQNEARSERCSSIMENRDLSTYEILDLIGTETSQVDAAFEFWLTITFAFVVAAFAARTRFSMRLKLLVSSLYLVASAVFILKYVGDLSAVQTLTATLPETAPNLFNIPGGLSHLLRFALYVVGTIAAIVYLFLPGTIDSEDSPA